MKSFIYEGLALVENQDKRYKLDLFLHSLLTRGTSPLAPIKSEKEVKAIGALYSKKIKGLYIKPQLWQQATIAACEEGFHAAVCCAKAAAQPDFMRAVNWANEAVKASLWTAVYFERKTKKVWSDAHTRFIQRGSFRKILALFEELL